MSISLSLEIERGLTQEELLRVALGCGAVVPTDEHPAGTLAIFPSSGLDLFVHSDTGRSTVLAEGLATPPVWKVGMRVSLGFLMEQYDQCNLDVRRFLDALAAQSRINFVLSFQNETVYAVRDTRGLRYIAQGAHV